MVGLTPVHWRSVNQTTGNIKDSLRESIFSRCLVALHGTLYNRETENSLVFGHLLPVAVPYHNALTVM